MLCYEGKLSLYCFCSALMVLFIYELLKFYIDFSPFDCLTRICISILYYGLLNILIRIKYTAKDYQIAVRATFLGFILCVGVNIFQSCSTEYRAFGIYASLMAIFHYSEFLGIAYSNPSTLTPDSFILNHSIHYGLAAASSWVEFFIEVYYFPEIKKIKWLWLIGFIVCICGELLRKLAMITASKNFSHVVQFERHENHELVTHGVYSWVRHPSYVGWFWWSIGTQIVLSNPICFIIYTIASWKFFHDRIFMEEITLLNFFGEDYYKYQQNVPTGLPFIKGFKVEL
uniref:Protein-S-isoprenylcysteine O-methyltransferase n=1 Tax=Corethrella appendiculata TaxID=1370023 RepID=U5EKS2_9DIPT